MEIYSITLVCLNERKEMPLSVSVDEAEASENIIITATVDGNTIKISDGSYLSAYQRFRDGLLLLGYGIKCSGSRINAVQSGMMAATDRIYLVSIGRQALAQDIVPIWDYADIDEFPSTEEQAVYFERWSNSLNG